MNKIKFLLHKYKEILLYILFGGLTTAVNYIVYFVCKALGAEYRLATVLAWIAAVLFAYITNRIWVFESKNTGFKQIAREFFLFVAARVFSLGLELAVMYIGMELCNAGAYTCMLYAHIFPLGELISKTIAQFVVIITNYILSKCIIFRSKHRNEA